MPNRHLNHDNSCLTRRAFLSHFFSRQVHDRTTGKIDVPIPSRSANESLKIQAERRFVGSTFFAVDWTRVKWREGTVCRLRSAHCCSQSSVDTSSCQATPKKESNSGLADRRAGSVQRGSTVVFARARTLLPLTVQKWIEANWSLSLPLCALSRLGRPPFSQLHLKEPPVRRPLVRHHC